MNIGGGLNRNQHPGENPFLSFFKSIGVATLLCLVITIVIGISFSPLFMQIPVRVMSFYEIWRCFTFVFTNTGILGVVFNVLFILCWANTYEQDRGSLNLFPRIFILSGFLSIFDLLFYLLISYIWPAQAAKLVYFGFFRIYFLDMCVRCFEDPLKDAGLFCLPWPTPQITIIPIFLLFDILINNFYLGNVPVVIAALVLCKLLKNLQFTEFSERCARPFDSKLMKINKVLNYYPITQQHAASATVQLQEPRAFSGTQERVGGEPLSEDQRREQWLERFGPGNSPDLRIDLQIAENRPDEPLI